MTPARRLFVAIPIAALFVMGAATNPERLLAQAQTGAAAPKPVPSLAGFANEEPWPDLAVDETIVAQQQEEFRAVCEEDARRQVSIDCPCMVKSYPEFRLKSLSKAIRATEVERDSSCRADASSLNCKAAGERMAKLTSREAQIEFNPVFRNGTRPGQRKPNTSGFYVEYLSKCKNTAAVAREVEQDCLNGIRPSVPAGKSDAAFCTCISEHYGKGFEAAPGAFSSNLDVELKTAAYLACQK